MLKTEKNQEKKQKKSGKSQKVDPIGKQKDKEK